MIDEHVYDATRADELVFALGRRRGLSRRELLRLGALGLPLVAGFARLAAPGVARADNGSPISKPLPSQLFVNFGSNAEMRWDAMAGLGYTIPNDPIVDQASWRLSLFGTGLKGAPAATSPLTFTLDALRALPAKTIYSLWNTTQYVLTGPSYPGSPPVTTQVVKSAFELAFGAQLKAGVAQMLTGRSWSGAGTIKRVDVSTDGGTTWAPAQLNGANVPRAWARWTFGWAPPGAGSYTLEARATDSAGNVQPTTSPFNDGGYLFGAVVRHLVTAV